MDTAEPDLARLMEELKSHEDRTLIKRIMIKCADVSNPTRPIQVYKQWAERIAAEYCDQVRFRICMRMLARYQPFQLH